MTAARTAIWVALRRLGVTVIDTSAIGKDGPDAFAYWRDRWTALKFTTAKKKLTQAQQDAHALAPVCVIRTLEDALSALGLSFGMDRGSAWRATQRRQEKDV